MNELEIGLLPGEMSGSLELHMHEEQRQLFELVHSELYKRAEAAMRRQRTGHTLQATALVSEVYVKVAGGKGQGWRGKSHFFAVAAQAMRQILIDHARRYMNAPKATNESVLLENTPEFEDQQIDVMALDETLERFAKLDPLMAKAVEMRCYTGASREEIASVLGLKQRTFDRKWQAAKAWVLAELS